MMMLRISIHALREESDKTVEVRKTCPKLISIHALREESDSSWTARKCWA